MNYQFTTHNTTQVKQKLHKYFPVYLPNVLDRQQINDIDHIAKNASSQNAKVGQDQGVVDASMRRTEIKWLTPDITPPEFSKYFEQIIKRVNADHFQFEIAGMEAFQYGVYDASIAGHYNWHTDMSVMAENELRKISMSLLLNDPSEYEGGNLLLNVEGSIVVAQEKIGQAIFFPSWMPHCVTPVTKGVRKSLVTWIHGPQLR